MLMDVSADFAFIEEKDEIMAMTRGHQHVHSSRDG